jgi:excisionase family DNA binding protein
MDKRVYTTGEVAKICDVTVVTVNKWFDSGRLEGYRMPGSNRRRIPHDCLVKFLKENGMPMDRLDDFRKRALLVVDDEEEMRETIMAALREEFRGFEVVGSADGYDACLKAGKLKPDLIVLDIFMPKMNGFEVCRTLKADPKISKCRILGITGMPEEGSPAQLLEAGADDCLVKPFEMAALVNKVRRLLGIRVVR